MKNRAIHQNLNGARNWPMILNWLSPDCVITRVDIPLASLLRFDKRFDLVYEDKVAPYSLQSLPQLNTLKPRRFYLQIN